MKPKAILESSPSLFGEISVGESFQPAIRWMKINNEIEGQVFCFPDASVFSCLIDGPGAISASRYLYAFIIAAWQFPDQRGLILGLGAGIGATMLLALFPQLSLTVVEIDFQVITFARRYFPLVSFYESQGRLQIVQANAENYLNQCSENFAFTLLDLFAGDESNHHNLPLINSALKVAPYFMANIITSQVMLDSIERSVNLNDNNSSVSWLRAFPALPSEKANWIMTNIDAISPAIREYKLFSDIVPVENIITANEYFIYILSQVDAACFYR